MTSFVGSVQNVELFKYGGSMKKKALLLIVAIVGVLALLVPATSSAGPLKNGACVEQTVGQLHIQVGYCP